MKILDQVNFINFTQYSSIDEHINSEIKIHFFEKVNLKMKHDFIKNWTFINSYTT